MRRLVLLASILLTLIGTVASAQVRGRGRLQGNVKDKKTGQPIAGATITISGNSTEPIVTKSDSRGHWAAIGMTSGMWNIDIAAPGYMTSRGTANISEVSTAPPVNIELNPEVKQEAVAPTPSVPREAVDAIKEGQELLKAQAGDVVTTTDTTGAGSATAVSHAVTADEVKQNAAKAVADFEKALPQVPDTTPQLHEVRLQIMDVLATAYFRAGDVPKAIATLEQLTTLDPAGATPDAVHVNRELRLANLYLANNQLDQGRALIEKLPPNAITDPTAYLNIGVLLYNKNKPADAMTYFTKAIQLDAKSADFYYYRALAELQLKKNADAKADLQQVLTLAPTSSEASDAKQLLAGLK